MTDKLAIDGGSPAKKHPLPPMFPGGMAIDQREEDAVVELLRNKRLFRYYGPSDMPSKVAEFEGAFAKRMEVDYARAVSSGTAALICALVGVGVGVGDEVIVPAYTWVSTASAVLMLGAIPVIAEVDESLTLDVEDVSKKINKRTRAIMAVHMCGASADMDGIMALATKHKIAVIEDVAQAIGGAYRGRPLGSIGDAGTFSLQFNKIITTGEGGLVTTKNRDVWLRASTYHDPISISMGRDINEDEAPHFGGQNYRASEFVGAVGLVQLQKLDRLIATMRARKNYILQGLSDLDGVKFRKIHNPEGDVATSIVFFLPSPSKAKRFKEALTAENVRARNLYDPEKQDYHVYAHWQHIMNKVSTTEAGFPWAKRFYDGNVEYTKGMCPKTLDLLERSVLFDVSPLLVEEDAHEIVTAVKKVASAIL